MSEAIKNAFNEISKEYDKQREKLIPCFSDFYQTVVDLAKSNKENPVILDIGAGTGLLSQFLLNRYTKGHFTLIDLSEDMLSIAKKRFENLDRINFIHDNYLNVPLREITYDIIVSALSIHHLSTDEKSTLYRKCYKALKANGVFINADQVLGTSRIIDKFYKDDWKNRVEQSGLSNEELQAAYERTKLDKMDTLETNVQLLNECNFSMVDCVYKYYNFVVLYAEK